MDQEQTIIFVIGVSGVGKSTIAKLLSEKLDCTSIDADDFHPPSNIAKMENGKALTDDDRKGWLLNINSALKRDYKNISVIIACSALKEMYREQLADGIENIKWISLHGDFDLIHTRMLARNHFMPSTLLQSQFDTWEAPAYGISIDVKHTPEEIIQLAYNYIKEDHLIR